jgi:hypothetical protein
MIGMSPAALQVCEDCFGGLVRLGAAPESGPVSITGGKICDAHPTNLQVQATRVVYAEPMTFQAWRIESRGRLSTNVPPPLSGPESLQVAHVAGVLLTGLFSATDVEIDCATETARKILAAAKGAAL